ncbi:DNA-binding transcriptional repressor MarR [Acholeplasma oculi]|uniref:Transcriptional regulator, MarR-type n=1 Tax=Acholeplasma oculi TaxID=35623 RepID=A0A061AC45_9MOLU|nr:MarR family transcriptional regulator [Acholeplasma oculi]CDR31445.1 Transcriptional regulator, MarR-type [Acholeplasma oculi]SKC40053.1 DNA-binding transcriptional regulator, MarR family [Acholeplasma oculi]SUT92074.1 DNA-binding transcriptional repressor MarR [Acholeplasma oculi]HLS99942.1 MarR family transcriptional regulator [Acholeplasma sp.]
MSTSKEIINTLLVDVFNHILSIEERTLKEKGVTLSMTEVHVLEAIRNTDIPTMGEVAKRLRVTLGTLTTSINILSRKKHVYRYSDEKDRRKVYLKLTDQAKKVLSIHDAFHNEMISAIFTDLNIDQDEVLMKSLSNITEYFKTKY